MKMMKKKLLLLGLLISIFLVNTGAYADTVIDIPFEVNPVYVGILTAEDLLEGWVPEGEYIYDASETLSSEISSQSNSENLRRIPQTKASVPVDKLAAQLRQAMVEHKGIAKLSYNGELSGARAMWKLILDRALFHTGVPDEGDYLKWSYGGCYGEINNVGNQITLIYTIRYHTTAAQGKAEVQAFQDVYNTITSSLADDASEMRITRAIYDYIIDTVDYDHEHDASYILKHTAYAALIDHLAVCQGYALVMYRLMLMFGIDSRIAVSATHAWNYANIDGVWYQLDATWGDVNDAEHSAYFADYYFLKRDGAWTDKSHVLNEKEMEDGFKTNYPLSDSDFVTVTSVSITDVSGNDVQGTLDADYLEDSVILSSKVLPADAGQMVVCSADIADRVLISSSEDRKSCVIEFVEAGDTVITMKSHSDTDVTDSVSLHVVSSKPAESINLKDQTGSDITDRLTYNKYQVPSVTLTAVVSPSDASNRVKWESSNPTAVMISGENNNSVTLKFGDDGDSTVSARMLDGSGVKTEVLITVFGEHIRKITVNAPDTVNPGSKADISASIDPVTALNQKLNWSVTVDGKPSKMAVLKNGILTVNKKIPAPCTVRVSAASTDGSDVLAYKDIYVPPLVSEVQILDADANVMNGTYSVGLNQTNEFQLRVNTLPEAAGDEVIWKSSSVKIAEVDQTGLVTFYKAGTVTITAAAADGSGKKASVKLVGKTFVTGITLSGPDTVAAGKTSAVSAVVSPEDAGSKKLTWTVLADGQPTKQAKVSNGNVTVNAKTGSGVVLTVIAKAADGSDVTASKDIRVVPLVSDVRLLSPQDQVLNGTTYPVDLNDISEFALRTELMPADAGQGVTWKSSNANIADVSDNGLVSFTGRKFGTVTITATAADGSKKQASCKFTVTRLVTDIVIDGPDAITAGKSGTFTYTVSPTNASNKKVKWTVTEEGSKTTLASVVNGKVTVKEKWPEGKQLKLTAKAADESGVKAVKMINVIPQVSSVTVSVADGANAVMRLGDTAQLQLRADVSPAEARQDVKWKSSATGIVTVDKNGLLTAKKAGKATITASALDGSGQSGKLSVTVKKERAVNTVLLDNDLLNADINVQDEIPEITAEAETKLSAEAVPEENDISNEKYGQDTEKGSVSELPEGALQTGNEMEAGIAVPHFTEDDVYLLPGESRILGIENPQEEAILVGLSGETGAVLWNEELNMVTAVGEAEVTAFISTMDPITVTDMMQIHVVNEIPEKEEETETGNEADIIENEPVSETEADAVKSADELPEELPAGEIDAEITEEPGASEQENDTDTGEEKPVVTGDEKPEVQQSDETKSGEMTENTSEPEAQQSDETESGEVAADIPESEEDELILIDLNPDEALTGMVNEKLNIGREHFDMDNDTFSRLIFIVENESVAVVTERVPEEQLLLGVEIQLRSAGETKLFIKRDGREEPLYEISLVVMAPVDDNPEAGEIQPEEPDLIPTEMPLTEDLNEPSAEAESPEQDPGVITPEGTGQEGEPADEDTSENPVPEQSEEEPEPVPEEFAESE